MAVSTPQLDVRTAQDLVDHAKRLIPQLCPEWTDHNVSDPGVTLIELFAWMADLLIYRVNQVPDRMYDRFLELIGMRRQPPQVACAPITFYLAEPQPNPVTIPGGTEVATVRTETDPAVIFTTSAPLIIYPPHPVTVLTGNGNPSLPKSLDRHDIRALNAGGPPIAVFSPPPVVGDAFYIGFTDNHSNHLLALLLDCERASGAIDDRDHPPWEWHVSSDGPSRWAPCAPPMDTTGGFNQAGEIALELPAMALAEYQGIEAYWLRCRLNAAQAGGNRYRTTPRIQHLAAESRGGITEARHVITVTGELLGASDGSSGQTFSLLHHPVLELDPATDYLEVQPSPTNGPWEPWQAVPSFALSQPNDQHYVLDHQEGSIALGLRLLQPSGDMYSFGAVPPPKSRLRFSRYQYGGGVAGNVLAGSLAVLKTSIPYVARVVNREAAAGGLDAQSVDDARVRAPGVFSSRDRAVTARDFEFLACEGAEIARACCLAPGNQEGGGGPAALGEVSVAVLPRIPIIGGRISPEALQPAEPLLQAAAEYLRERCVLGIRLQVRPPEYVWVAAQVSLQLATPRTAAQAIAVRQEAEQALYRFLNPYTGGADGDGWPFGRPLHVSEIYTLLQRLPGVEYVEAVQLATGDPERPAVAVTSPLAMPPGGLVCSLQHTVTVRR